MYVRCICQDVLNLHTGVQFSNAHCLLSDVFYSVALASTVEPCTWSVTFVLNSVQIALQLCMAISADVDSCAQVQDGPNADKLPQMLADMCSQITIPIGSSVRRCLGILLKYDIGLAYFVTSDSGTIDLFGGPLSQAHLHRQHASGQGQSSLSSFLVGKMSRVLCLSCHSRRMLSQVGMHVPGILLLCTQSAMCASEVTLL